MELRVNGIIEESIVDGPGIRYVVFTQGCYHDCEGCHNPETHCPNGGKVKRTREILTEVKENPLISGVTFSGGEPMLHAAVLSSLCDELKKIGKDIVVYSGHTFEEITSCPNMLDFASKCDILVDGKFEVSRKNLLLTFKGSENQRIIDVAKSLENNEIIEIEFNEN